MDNFEEDKKTFYKLMEYFISNIPSEDTDYKQREELFEDLYYTLSDNRDDIPLYDPYYLTNLKEQFIIWFEYGYDESVYWYEMIFRENFPLHLFDMDSEEEDVFLFQDYIINIIPTNPPAASAA